MSRSTVSDSIALDQWIRRNNIKRTNLKTAPSPSFECIPKDDSTLTQTNELQEYFALNDFNADTGVKVCIWSMDNPTQR